MYIIVYIHNYINNMCACLCVYGTCGTCSACRACRAVPCRAVPYRAVRTQVQRTYNGSYLHAARSIFSLFLRGRSKLSTFMKAYRGYAREGGGGGEGLETTKLFSKINILC